MYSAGYTFGTDITEQFLHRNNLKRIIRGHQLVMEGYNICHDKQLITLCSVPNYCYRCGNRGAILEIDENMNEHFLTFEFAPKKFRKGIQCVNRLSKQLKMIPFDTYDFVSPQTLFS